MPYFPVIGEGRNSANELFWRGFRAGSELFQVRQVSTPHGTDSYDVLWREEYQLWGAYYEMNNRYWNAFGFANRELMSESKALNVDFEINPPRPNFEISCSGYFLINGHGQFYIGHNGKFGGGRVKGITIKNFKRYCQEMGINLDWQNVEMPNRRCRSFVVFGPLSNGRWIKELARFGRAGYDFKKYLKEQQQNERR